MARLEAIRDPTGNQLTMGYTTGRLTSVQDNLGAAGRTGLTLSYFPDERLQQIADWTGRSWSYTYDPTGNLATATNPLGDTTRYAYAPGTSLLVRLAKALRVSTDEMLGVKPPSSNGAAVSRRVLRRLQAIDGLPKRDQDALFRVRTIDAFHQARTAG